MRGKQRYCPPARRDVLPVTAQPARPLAAPSTPGGPSPRLGDRGRPRTLGTARLLGTAGGVLAPRLAHLRCSQQCWHRWWNPPPPSLCRTKASRCHPALPGDASCRFQSDFGAVFPGSRQAGVPRGSPRLCAPAAAAGAGKEDAPPEPGLRGKGSSAPCCSLAITPKR